MLISSLLIIPFNLSIAASPEPVMVLTQHNNNSRTGANLEEDILTTSNVNQWQFGKLFSRPVDGQIYAQPLYVSDLNFPNKGTRNVVYVATQHNSVYAFDADDPNASTPFWQVNLGPSAPVPNDDFGNQSGPYNDIQIEVGITSTPVIDLSSGTIYVVAFIKGVDSYSHRLYALDIRTGEQKFNSPVPIVGEVAGSGTGSANGRLIFQSKLQLQRPGLLLSNGVLYIAFGSYAATGDYHGWVFGYDAKSLQQVAVYNTTPDGWEGGVWQSGQGIAADEQGQLYFIAGDGRFTGDAGGQDRGNSFIKLKPAFNSSGSSNGFEVLDWFTPHNQAEFNRIDLDVGSDGVLLIPGTNLLLGGSKAGTLYLLNRDNLGHYQSDSDSQIVQSLQASERRIYGSPIYWNSPDSGSLIYVWPEKDTLKAFRLTSNHLETQPVATSHVTAPRGIPGGILSLSADGSTPGSGVVWASMPLEGDANKSTSFGILRAFDASNVSKELWNSEENQADDLGTFAKFCPPTVANGKVYMATFSNQLVVYGLRTLPGKINSDTR